MLRLKPDGRGLTVVGDDAQSIYSFRAATVRNILDYPDRFKPKAHIVTLEQNYRSTQPILYACNKVMEFAQERYTKNLFSERPSQQRPYLTTVTDDEAQAHYVVNQTSNRVRQVCRSRSRRCWFAPDITARSSNSS